MKRYKTKLPRLLILVLLLTVISPVACQDGDEDARKKQHLKDLEALKVKRDSTLKVLGQMELPALVEQMNRDSRDREHFNSPAYREVVRKRRAEGQDLFNIISKEQKVTYIPLMALRNIDKEAYGETDPRLRLTALTDAFEQTIFYNRWGIPHLYWQAPAKSMIELGEVAEEALKDFLKDQSPARIMGHEEEMELERYKYRRCDYALAMLMAIRNQNVKEISRDPAQRDKMIEDVLAKED